MNLKTITNAITPNRDISTDVDNSNINNPAAEMLVEWYVNDSFDVNNSTHVRLFRNAVSYMYSAGEKADLTKRGFTDFMDSLEG